jgi:hypothetical protein
MRVHLARFLQPLLLSVAFGALVGVARYCLPIYSTPAFRPGISASQFVQILRNRGADGVRDLVIYPVLDGKNYVTGIFVRSPNQGLPFQFNAGRPFQFGSVTARHDIRTFLAAEFPNVSYRYAWWISPLAQALFWGAGAALAFAAAFNIIKSRMPSGGENPEVNLLAGFDGKKSEPISAPAPTVEEAAAVGEFNAAIEASIHTNAKDSVATSEAQPTAQPIRVLSGNSEPATQLPKDQRPKDYQGEFYPVSKSSTPKK